METKKKVAIVRIVWGRSDLRCKIEYDELEDLASSVNEFLSESPDPIEWGDSTFVTLPSGKSYQWSVAAAHYCFAKGRISESEFVAQVFGAEQEGGEL